MKAPLVEFECRTCGTRPFTLEEFLEIDEDGRCPECRRAWVLFVRVTGMLLVMGLALALFAAIVL